MASGQTDMGQHQKRSPEQNEKQPADQGRKWLSSKLEVSLMDELDAKAKSIGLSRSEAVRKAITQWLTTEDPGIEQPGRYTTDPEISRIPQRLERIEATLVVLTDLSAGLGAEHSGKSTSGQAREDSPPEGGTRAYSDEDPGDPKESAEAVVDEAVDEAVDGGVDEADEADSETASGDGIAGECSTDNTQDTQESLTGVQLREGDDLLNWIDEQAQQSQHEQQSQNSQ